MTVTNGDSNVRIWVLIPPAAEAIEPKVAVLLLGHMSPGGRLG